MTFNKRLFACLRFALTCLVWIAAGSHAAAGPGEPVRMDMSMTSDGALEVAYTLPSGVTQLRFLNGPTDADFRRKHMKSADGCGALSSARMVLRKGTDCAGVMRWRVDTPRLLRVGSQSAVEPTGEAAVLIEMGTYLAVTKGHGLKWQVQSPQNGHIIGQGEVTQRALSLESPAKEVDQWLNTVYHHTDQLRPPALHWNHFVLVRNPNERLAPLYVLRDPAFADEKFNQIHQTLQEAVNRLTRAYGTHPSAPHVVLARPTDVQSDHLLIRDVLRWWSAEVYKVDEAQSWLVMGHDEWSESLLRLDMGRGKEEKVADVLEGALNRCAKEYVAKTFPETLIGYDHRCGVGIMALAFGLHAARNPSSAESRLDTLASLHRGKVPLDVHRLVAWADGSDISGTLHQVLMSKKQAFSSGLSAALSKWGIADTLAVEDMGSDLPIALANQLNFTLLNEVVLSACRKATGGNSSRGIYFHLRKELGCSHLIGGQDIVSVQGVPLMPNALKAWNTAQEACRVGHSIKLGYADGSSSQLRCPTTWPEKPYKHWIKLRPDALVRLGIARPV